MSTTSTRATRQNTKLAQFNSDLADMLPRLYFSAGIETPKSADAHGFTPRKMPTDLRDPPRSAINLDPEFLSIFTEMLKTLPADVKQAYEKCNIYKYDLGDLKKRKVAVPLPEPEFLAVFSATNRFKASDPKIPMSWAESIEKQARAAYTSGRGREVLIEDLARDLSGVAVASSS